MRPFPQRSMPYRLAAGLLSILLLFGCGPESGPGGEIKANLMPLPLPARNYWPTKGWQIRELSGADRWKALDEYAFKRTGSEEERAGIRTDGVVIIKDGYLVYERYAAGYDENTVHLTWSVSKSIMQALIGIAIKDGLLDLDTKMRKFYPELKKEKPITVRNLLHMSSGLDANEGYESGPLKSTVIAMLYTRGRHDMARFCASVPLRADPGTYVYYSSCDTNILSGMLKEAIKAAASSPEEGLQEYAEFPWRRLFNPLGMEGTIWERDGSNTFVGSSYVYATPRNMAKLAFLYVNNGNWDGKQLLPDGWLDFTRTVAPGYTTTPHYKGWDEANYAGQWYANTGIPEAGVSAPWPSAPPDTFAALGHWGQSIFIIPSLDMIVVRTADDRDHTFDDDQFLKLAIEAVQK